MEETIFIDGNIGMNAPPKLHPEGVVIRLIGDVFMFAMSKAPGMAYHFEDIWKYKIREIIAYSKHTCPETRNILEILDRYVWERGEQKNFVFERVVDRFGLTKKKPDDSISKSDLLKNSETIC